MRVRAPFAQLYRRRNSQMDDQSITLQQDPEAMFASGQKESYRCWTKLSVWQGHNFTFADDSLLPRMSCPPFHNTRSNCLWAIYLDTTIAQENTIVSRTNESYDLGSNSFFIFCFLTLVKISVIHGMEVLEYGNVTNANWQKLLTSCKDPLGIADSTISHLSFLKWRSFSL